jgi:putative intracellular protease/amidase
VEILLILDNDYGGNYHFIRTIFERFGWSITTTALTPNVTPCIYQDPELVVTVDILLPEIPDVSAYDAISVMPGESHDLLLTNQTALDFIHEANASGIVVSAWCRAVRVLAAADVIDGRNVTGHLDYESEYEAAGATFFASVPPIIDENLVTAVRSRFYRDEMCAAIADAIGVYEPDPPALLSASVTPTLSEQGTNLTVLVELTDITSVYIVTAKVYSLNATGDRDPMTHICHFELYNTSCTCTEWNATLAYLEPGNYTLDVKAWDNWMNEIEYFDTVQFEVVDELPETTTSTTGTGMPPLVIAGVAGASVVIVLLVVVVVRRR